MEGQLLLKYIFIRIVIKMLFEEHELVPSKIFAIVFGSFFIDCEI